MNCFLLAFLITNALFWSLFPHSAHCKVLSDFNKIFKLNLQCPSHKLHILIGIIFFLLAIYFSQKDSPELKNIFN